MSKRLFDVSCAAVGLVCLMPLFAVIALAIKLDSPGPVFFRGARAGRGGELFKIFKFRTMVADASQLGAGITTKGDARITRAGRILRHSKLDELPQLLNVVRGEMSLVGPRPEDPRYVAHYTPEQRQVLAVLPGITSAASVRYRREEELLDGTNWEDRYLTQILPSKLALELDAIKRRTLLTDLGIIVRTVRAMFR